MDVKEGDISSFHGNLSLLASVMAVGLASSYYQQEKKFVSPVDDRQVTLRLEGKDLGIFCFKRIRKKYVAKQTIAVIKSPLKIQLSIIQIIIC